MLIWFQITYNFPLKSCTWVSKSLICNKNKKRFVEIGAWFLVLNVPHFSEWVYISVAKLTFQSLVSTSLSRSYFLSSMMQILWWYSLHNDRSSPIDHRMWSIYKIFIFIFSFFSQVETKIRFDMAYFHSVLQVSLVVHIFGQSSYVLRP